MIPFQERVYVKKIPPSKSILVADVGGTHTNFAIFQKRKFLLSLNYLSKDIGDFYLVIKEVLQHLQKYQVKVTKSCFSVAGPVQGTKSKLTNLPWTIDLQQIKKKTGLTPVLINDFQAISQGIDALPKKDIIQIKPGKAVPKTTRAVLGAGTGFGKSIVFWDQEYKPQPSEGGHATLPVQNKQEWELLQFIQKKQKTKTVAWESILSGGGITNIYQFRHAHQHDPTYISQCKDQKCRFAMKLFFRFYARAAKNLALDALATGGVYLAGGIIAKNYRTLNRKEFKEEFNASTQMGKLLQTIPVYVITNYNVSLYGAAVAAEQN